MKVVQPADRERQTWDELADMDPFWTALTMGRKPYGWNTDDFFATGVTELAEILAVADRNGVGRNRGWALDFGCGPGRITRAAAALFDMSVGVDISERMIEHAQELNASCKNCRFETIDGRSLPHESGTFDFVFSTKVLQHMTRQQIRRILPELARVLAPDGLLVVQLPHRLPLRRRFQLKRGATVTLRGLGVPISTLITKTKMRPFRMTALAEDEVRSVLAESGLSIVEVVPSVARGSIEQRTYWATRPADHN